MIKLLITLALMGTMSTSAAETYTSLHMGSNTNITGCSVCWENGGGIGTMFRIGRREAISSNINIDITYTHLSQINIGYPFNNRAESSVDFLGIGLEYVF